MRTCGAIFIAGPTATGKTDLALALLPFLLTLPYVTGVDILVADSKQAYIGQDIVTGKDSAKINAAIQEVASVVSVYGIDVVAPDEEWSVSHFLAYAASVCRRAQATHRLVLVVGGTGQYLSSLLAPPKTAIVPRDPTLRRQLDALDVVRLQQRLVRIDPGKFEDMNHSDRNNPRRLVRAIEVAMFRAKPAVQKDTHPDERSLFLLDHVLWVGLACDKAGLEQRIRLRVEQRIKSGALAETSILQKKYSYWSDEAHSAIGYAEIETYQRGEINARELLELWTKHEVQYAKRQLTWFQKLHGIEWFDCADTSLKTKVVKRIGDWYTGLYGDNKD